MHIGLHVMKFTYPGGAPTVAHTMERVVQRADEVGIHSFWPMDHFFQIPIADALTHTL